MKPFKTPWGRTLLDVLALLVIITVLDWLTGRSTDRAGFATMLSVAALVQAYRAAEKCKPAS